MQRVSLAVCLVLLSSATALAQSGPSKPPVRWEPAASDHFNRGRAGQRIDMVVIHTVEGSQSSCVATFRGSRRVSAHYVVGKDGSVVQCVRDEDTAWHAGGINHRAIGIEHEGFAQRADTWNDTNMRASARLTRWLCDTYRIPIDRQHIVGHCEVPRATHYDPGRHFDWDRYMALVRGDQPQTGDARPGTETPTDGDGIPTPPDTRPGNGTGTTPPVTSRPADDGGACREEPTTDTRRPGSRGTGIAPALDGVARDIRENDPDRDEEHGEGRPLLGKGMAGEWVYELQRTLNAAGEKIRIDGIFGPETEAAVRKFQSEHGCKVDGLVGPETWGALDRDVTLPRNEDDPIELSKTPARAEDLERAATLDRMPRGPVPEGTIVPLPLDPSRGSEPPIELKPFPITPITPITPIDELPLKPFPQDGLPLPPATVPSTTAPTGTQSQTRVK